MSFGSAPAEDATTMAGRPVPYDGRATPEAERQEFAPQPGSVLLWESWLRHEVPVGTSKAERISISFNYR